MKRVAILGSTGSIGTQTLDVIRGLPGLLKVTKLAAQTNGALLKEQAAEFGVKDIALCDESAAQHHGVRGGMDAIVELATADDVDIVVVSVAGVIGLIPTIEAIKARKNIALASKEVLVAAGQIVMPMLAEHGVTMTPIDSEHSAIFQCLLGSESRQIRRLLLTASGGPFRGWKREDLAQVTTQQVLNHPTWNMGGKITVDSATLMNKGLEIIEAHWLFGVPLSQVEVVIHPQSVIHSMVEFWDGSALGQMGWPNMRLPIQYALLHPERVANDFKPWNPVETPNLTFESPDLATFRCLNLAREAGEKAGSMPCAMSAANEEAANALIKGQCGFLQIAEVVEKVMAQHDWIPDPTLEDLIQVDAWARGAAWNAMSAQPV